MTTPQELSGLLNLAIRYLRELTERGSFDEPETVANAMSEYKKTSDPMVAFLEEKCYHNDTELLEVVRTVLYNAYKDFCDDAKAYTEPRGDFYERLRGMYPNMREEQLRRGGKPVRLFIGGPALLTGSE